MSNGQPPLQAPMGLTALAEQEALHSVNAGAIIQRTGLLRNKYRSEGREFARQIAEHVNVNYPGVASAFVYEETFGTQDRVHWLIHLRQLEDYQTMVRAGDEDEEFRTIGEERDQSMDVDWETMFVDGSIQETLLLPHHPGMYGTTPGEAPGQRRREEVRRGRGNGQPALETPLELTALEGQEALHSGNAGAIIQRTGLLRNKHRSEGREFARKIAEHVNVNYKGVASAFTYEETFGTQDRIHWLIHLRQLEDYQTMVRAGDEDEEFRTIGEERDQSMDVDWETMFVDGSIQETLLLPHHPRMYGT